MNPHAGGEKSVEDALGAEAVGIPGILASDPQMIVAERREARAESAAQAMLTAHNVKPSKGLPGVEFAPTLMIVNF